MPIISSDIVSNIEINKGSILLLFSDADTKIVRSWRHSKKDVVTGGREIP